MQSGLTEVDLARFAGKELDYFNSAFVPEAMSQAEDLFQFATGLTIMPETGTFDYRLAKRGILAMAEALFESNAHRDLRFSPYKSETIGTYTYTLVEGKVLASIPTGVSWFDVAVDRLAVTNRASIASSSISAFDRPGDVVELDGRGVLIGPADTEEFVQGPRMLRGPQPS